jgi:quercetin dioxygenase-like cupin family protein
MTTLSRRDLSILATSALVAAASGRAHAQTAPYGGQGVKVNIIMEPDLAGFSPQTTRLTLVEIASGSSIPKHMHPFAQEIVFVLDGTLVIDVDGQGTKNVKAGETLLLPAGLGHFPRATNASAKVLAIHSITDKTKPFRVDLPTS